MPGIVEIDMMDYTLIAGLLLYFLTIKIMANDSLRPLSAALIVTLGYFIVSTILQGIILSAYNAPLWQLFSWVPISTLVLQFSIALLSFFKIYNSDDSYGSWILWSIVGCLGIFIVAPHIATSVFAQF